MIMNIIKIENYKSCFGSTHSIEIKSDHTLNVNKGYIIVLSEEDINNLNTLIKLRGYLIDVLLIPKKFKFTFNDTDYYNLIKIQLSKRHTISYY